MGTRNTPYQCTSFWCRINKQAKGKEIRPLFAEDYLFNKENTFPLIAFYDFQVDLLDVRTGAWV